MLMQAQASGVAPAFTCTTLSGRYVFRLAIAPQTVGLVAPVAVYSSSSACDDARVLARAQQAPPTPLTGLFRQLVEANGLHMAAHTFVASHERLVTMPTRLVHHVASALQEIASSERDAHVNDRPSAPLLALVLFIALALACGKSCSCGGVDPPRRRARTHKRTLAAPPETTLTPAPRPVYATRRTPSGHSQGSSESDDRAHMPRLRLPSDSWLWAELNASAAMRSQAVPSVVDAPARRFSLRPHAGE